ncbi:probable cytochrome P450 6a14 [Diorhabda sublineata]|uniref:probable cytochrome P450 6a14 n=1 Tax=Diorhabda sublineata TaxID=1163346 RepID=UPI0024E0B399|nr:probable cytochrome P450 6a14 [Diorhabda sublineata]XP_056643079.1 probable cytochrome P450 6a14 [Diorhabda sublineata]XP_056643080.1 probable cytochrome P450 6a14 [Diorhabda sublineata]XP_056643081.1 probable cytochrome P450 6a14 [Diorhabda sublineata]XP_056643082.1 probable cytochrome P450 6a14 [Diorhabda sublineata]
MVISIWVYLITTIITLIYFYSKRKYSYWKDRNVYYIEPEFPFGNVGPVIKRQKPTIEFIQTIYDEIKSRKKMFGGMYSFFSPQFIPVDLDLVKCIMQKDFVHFPNRGMLIDEKNDPLSGHLFNLEDEKWRNLRAKLTPTFTSGKMKMMFQTMLDCTEGLNELLVESARKKEPVDIKETLACFTTDVIGSVAFGIEINSMKNPDSDFRKYGKKIFTSSWKTIIKFSLLRLLPKWLTTMLKIKVFEKDTETFYMNLVKDTIAYREKNNVYRKDFMHLLIQLKNIGKISENDDDPTLIHKNTENQQALTLNEIAAQSFVFFIAGFETSATTMTFALLELAQRQDIQDKLREDINEVLARHDNEITYEAIMEMTYLEKVVLETLRKHPPLTTLPRICTKSYKIPNSNLVLEAGTRVVVPVYCIQRDPEYYPDPENFDPERFNEENKSKRNQFAYMPFGEGPRTCIGLRFGKLQAKVGLCSVLKNYKVTLNEKTQLPIKYDIGFIASVKGGAWLNLEKIK